MMGGGMTITSDSPLIGGSLRPHSLSIAYSPRDALTHCYRLWCWVYADTDLF